MSKSHSLFLAIFALVLLGQVDKSSADVLPPPAPCSDCQLPSCGDQVSCAPCDPNTPPVQGDRLPTSPCGNPDGPIVEPEQTLPPQTHPDKTQPDGQE